MLRILINAKLKIASKLLRRGDLDGAERLLRRILSKEPIDVPALEQLAELASVRKDWGEAVKRWEWVLAVCDTGNFPVPKQAAFRLETARLAHGTELRKAGDLSGAETMLKQVLGGNTVHLRTLTQLADVASARKDWGEAVKWWEQVLAVCNAGSLAVPKQAALRLETARFAHGTALRKAGDLSGAETLLRQVIGGNSAHLGALTQLAEVATARKDWNEAIVRWERVLAVCDAADLTVPKQAALRLETARLAHGTDLRKTGDLSGAETLLRQVIGGNSAHLGALTQLAEVATARKDWNEAIVRWERVLVVCDANDLTVPKQAASRLEAARLAHAAELCKSGDSDGALTTLSVLLSTNPENHAALVEFTEINLAKKQWSEAQEGYVKLLGVERRRVSKVLQGMAAAFKRCGKLDQAHGVEKGAVLCGLADPIFVRRLLDIYAKTENWEAVADVFPNIAAINPLSIVNPQSARMIVKALKNTGQSKDASMVMQEAISVAEKQGAPFQNLAVLKEIQRNLQSNDDVPKVSELFYDEIYQASSTYKVPGNESVYLPAWQIVADLVKSNGYGKILDLGCGPGQFAEYLLEQAPHVQYTGVDFSGVAIETAQTRCPGAQFIQADVFSDGAIDGFEVNVVVMLEVLEHLHQDRELLEKLPSGSHVIASVPNFDAFGHVRFFKNADDVEKRYAFLFLNLEIMSVSLEKESSLFVMHGSLK